MNTSKEKCVKSLKNITGKQNIIFMEKCRDAAKQLISILSKQKKFEKLLLQEEGGWHTYPKLGKPNRLEVIRLPMKSGKVKREELSKHKESILIIHSMPGYAYNEDMEEIQKICSENSIILINDCCGSISTKNARHGDFIICSFGEYKPISVGGGGFIAANNNMKKTLSKIQAYNTINFEKLEKEISYLPLKLEKWGSTRKKIIGELSGAGFKAINELTGINVIIPFNSEKERETLINYCETNNYGFVECPKYIRTNKKAISIEVKRIGG